MTLEIYHTIDALKGIWEGFDTEASRLLVEGRIRPMDYSFYQSFVWNEFIEKQCYPPLFLRLARKRLDYVLAENDGVAVAIMPLLVSETSGKVEFTSWKIAGLNNAVMLPGAAGNAEACREIVSLMENRYRGMKFRLCDIPESSPLAEVASAMRDVEIIPRESFHLRLSRFACYEAYNSSLSKSTRQTLRTARNHLNRDGNWGLKVYGGKELPSGYLMRIWQIYYKRKRAWRSKRGFSYNKVMILCKALNACRNAVSRSLTSLSGARICSLELCGKPIAFAIYYLWEGNIIVPRLAIDDSYRKYSPGLVMLDELLRKCYEEGIRDFDLSRGEEDYKRRMGCEAERLYRYVGRF